MGKIIRLNVGGVRYDVSRDTLERCEDSMLAKLISGRWKEGNSASQEPIFIDRNGLLFQYVLDYLRTNTFHLPSSVSRAAVNAEFEYYGIANGARCEAGFFEHTHFLEKADEIMNEINQLAAVNAAKESAHVARTDHLPKQELVFFITIEYYKINPPPGTTLTINIPDKYNNVRTQGHYAWVREDLKKRGFEVLRFPESYSYHPIPITITIKREARNDLKV